MKEQAILNDIENTLNDTINLGSAIIVEISEEGERLHSINNNIKTIIKNAEETKSIIKSMESTPYQFWLWICSFFQWESTTNKSLENIKIETFDEINNTNLLLEKLKNQALIISNQLDSHLDILDEIQNNNNNAERKLTL